MQTQTAQNSHFLKQASGAFSLLTGVFLVYAVQSHLVTEAFMVLMSLFFDQFTVKSSSIFPDIALLVFFALATMGAFSVLKNHFAVTITSSVLAVVAALVWGGVKMLHRNNNDLTLGTVRLVLGIIAIALSLVFSIQFVAAGSTGGMIIGAILFCFVIEFCKTIFCGDILYFWETGQSNKVLFSSLIVLILFALSISAAVFVLSIAPAKQNAEIANFEERRAVLEKNVEAKKAELARCNPSHLTKCVTPRTAELGQMQTELNTFLNQADNRKLIEAQSNKEFWQKAANYLGSDPDSLQLNFAIARAVLLDLLGLILVSQYTAARRLQRSVIEGRSIVIEQKKDDSAAEVFALMNAKIAQLEQELSKAKELEKKDSAH